MRVALTLALVLALSAMASAKPGGECDGAADVRCEDYNSCPPMEPDCEREVVRKCTVWVMYLDLVIPVEDDRTLCQDDPYDGWS